MAAENSTDAQDEKEITVKKRHVKETTEDVPPASESTKTKESKITLYHWTQSFNSQKVGEMTFQHHASGQSSKVFGQLHKLEAECHSDPCVFGNKQCHCQKKNAYYIEIASLGWHI